MYTTKVASATMHVVQVNPLFQLGVAFIPSWPRQNLQLWMIWSLDIPLVHKVTRLVSSLTKSISSLHRLPCDLVNLQLTLLFPLLICDREINFSQRFSWYNLTLLPTLSSFWPLESGSDKPSYFCCKTSLGLYVLLEEGEVVEVQGYRKG